MEWEMVAMEGDGRQSRYAVCTDGSDSVVRNMILLPNVHAPSADLLAFANRLQQHCQFRQLRMICWLDLPSPIELTHVLNHLSIFSAVFIGVGAGVNTLLYELLTQPPCHVVAVIGLQGPIFTHWAQVPAHYIDWAAYHYLPSYYLQRYEGRNLSILQGQLASLLDPITPSQLDRAFRTIQSAYALELPLKEKLAKLTFPLLVFLSENVGHGEHSLEALCECVPARFLHTIDLASPHMLPYYTDEALSLIHPIALFLQAIF